MLAEAEALVEAYTTGVRLVHFQLDEVSALCGCLAARRLDQALADFLAALMSHDEEIDHILNSLRKGDNETRARVSSPDYRDYVMVQMRNRKALEWLKEQCVKNGGEKKAAKKTEKEEKK